ncbi:MAG: hypothetical protein ACIALR_10645 [Blastopirellula sp. JB062]
MSSGMATIAAFFQTEEATAATIATKTIASESQTGSFDICG